MECTEAVEKLDARPAHRILLTPQGKRLEQADVERLAQFPRLILVCGRYEGFDERISEILQPEPISVGDYILNGGEVAAMILIDAVIRLVPEVLGDSQSFQDDSFSGAEREIEFPQYTARVNIAALRSPKFYSAETIKKSPNGVPNKAVCERKLEEQTSKTDKQ